MALTDKDILVTPNRGQAAEPKIEFKGASASLGPQTISLNVYPTDNGTISFEGSAGQLFSITNSLSGTIYSVNDVSGIPSIEVLDTGLVKLAQYGGNVLIGTGTDNATDRLQVNGSITSTVLKSSVATGTAPLTVTSTTAVTNLNADLLDGNHASAFYLATNPSGYTSNVGTVTSVGGTGTVSGLTLSGTVTTSGNLTLGGTLAVTASNFASQTANTFLAAPNGAAGVPTFRTIVAADVPTLNQNTTGTAANVTGTVAVANGGTGATTNTAARTNLGATTLGANLFTITNPSAITFPRFNADNTVSALDAATFRTAIGAGTSSTTGTVTSITASTTAVSGLSLSGGTITGSGTIAITGTLAVTASNFASQTANTVLIAPNGAAGVPTFRALVAADIPTLNQNTTGTAANVTGTVAVANGGTGATTLTGLVKGNGTSAFTAATAGTDYAAPSTANAFTDTQSITVTSTSNALTITQLGTGNALVVEDSTNPDSTPFVVDASGNVGIGATAPGEKLVVGGAVITTGQTAANKTSAGSFDFNVGSNDARILSWGSAGVGGRISFWTGNGGTGTTQRMLIDGSGNVNVAGLTASKPVFTDASKNLTSTGTLGVDQGGTGATTNTAARTNLGATTLGANLFTITNPSAVTFPRFNADNTVSSLSAADFRTAIGAQNVTVSNDTTTNADTFYPGLTSNQTTGTLASVVVSSTKLYFNPSTGQLNATDFNSLSDATKKENVKTIDNATQKMVALRGVTFDWIETKKPSMGVIAQEVEEVVPEVVSTSSTGEKSVNYGALVGLLIQTVKEQNSRIEQLEKLINTLTTTK